MEILLYRNCLRLLITVVKVFSFQTMKINFVLWRFFGWLVVSRCCAFFCWKITCLIQALILNMIDLFLVLSIFRMTVVIVFKLWNRSDFFTIEFVSFSFNWTCFDVLLFFDRALINGLIIKLKFFQIAQFWPNSIGLDTLERIIYIFNQWALTFFDFSLWFFVCEWTFWNAFVDI
jgi:hypothetical protein